MFDRKLVLEDGSEFTGTGFGADTQVVCEVVFNTSLTGYQEILSDPSYTDQAVVMSYPLIGNYGITEEDFESRHITPAAFVIRDLNEEPSNYRATLSLRELMEENQIPGLYGTDTRRLVRSIRDAGSRRGILTGIDTPADEALRMIRDTPVPRDAVRRCSCVRKWYSRTSNPRWNVVVVDCGLKMNIIRMLNQSRCNVTIVPYHTGSEEILALAPDGVLVSNGPGDPVDVPETIKTLQGLLGRVPVFGICLGHQLTALACGARTYKLKFGHRGGNHPVRELATGRIEMTSQNHSYAVDPDSLSGTGLAVSHVNVLDGTVEGLCDGHEGIMTVQYHPESAPGPQDSRHLFGRFTQMMKERRG